MAEFRNIHTRIWKDEWFSELDPEGKLLFVYLFSNERASVCGLYELPLKFIVFETGIDKSKVIELMTEFEKADKAYYRDGVVWVVNLRKYNDSGESVKVRTRAEKDLSAIPDCWLKQEYYRRSNIPYPQNIQTPDTLSGKGERDRDGDGEGNRDGNGYGQGDGDDPAAPPPDNDPFVVLQRTAEKAGIRLNSPDDSKELTKLIDEGATVDDMLAGIAWKVANNGGKAIQYFSQIVGPTRTAVLKRKQGAIPTTPTLDPFAAARERYAQQ